MPAPTIQRMADDDLPAWAAIVANAYPGFGMHAEAERLRFVERMRAQQAADPSAGYFGLSRDGQLLGGMKLFDFQMTLLSAHVLAGGVGLVAVDLLHKKEHVARDLIAWFLAHYRARGAPIAILYPFRPDFYKQMGFGYGTKMSRYRFLPASLPATGDRSRVGALSAQDAEQARACYDRFAARRHGMIRKTDAEAQRMFADPAQRNVGFREGGELRGYLTFTFDQRGDNPLWNDLEIGELIYESPAALAGLLAFLRTQTDQVDRIVYSTQEEDFHHLLADPRDGVRDFLPWVYHESNTQGVGLMYRVIDVPAVFRALAGHDFGGQTCTLKLTVRDTFLPANDGTQLLRFERGAAQLLAEGDYDVEVRLEVAELSSLLMGCISFASLHTYGLAEISDPAYVETVTRLFRTERKPMCTTPF
jgi:predicted acetyltransferase